MPLQAVSIDERILARGSEAQQVEWQANVRELLSKGEAAVPGADATLHIGMTEQQFLLDFRAEEGRDLGSRAIPHELLAATITEYVDTVRQIASAQSHGQMEVLDMAKKVTHDRAGRLLKRELRDFDFDLETSRRLFTLLLSLSVDTTRLTGVHGHRTIR